MTNVRYSAVYQRFLDGVNILNIDITKVLSMGCIIDLDFHHRLFISTLGPAAVLTVLGAMYAVYRRIYRPSYYDFVVAVREEDNHRYVSVVLLLTFLMYSPVSSTLFQMFSCDELDGGKSYLRADYRIDCNSPAHRSLQVYAACMMLVYTAGIPILYGILLFRNRKALIEKSTRQEDAAIKSIYSLWKQYKPHRFYYELIECARRILLAGVVVFIFPNTTAQVAVAFVIAAFFMVLSEMVAPYESLWDAWINRIGHAIVFSTIYLALLLKIDVSDERDESQGVFGAILIAGQACMVLLVVSGSIVVTYRLMKWSP